MPKELSFGTCIYKIKNDTTFILLSKSSKNSEWGFLKGKIEKGETPSLTAIRETYEESSILLSKDMLENYFHQKNKKKDIGIFLVDDYNLNIKDKIIKNEEIYEIKFFDIKQLPKISKNQIIISKKIVDFFIKRRYFFS